MPKEYGKKPVDKIKEYLVSGEWTEGNFIDFLFLGNKGANYAAKDTKHYLGTVANEMIRNVKVNIFFMVK